MTTENNTSHLRVSAHWLTVLLQGFRSLGINPEQVLQQARLSAGELAEPDARIDLERTLLLWKAAAAATDQPLGLRLGDYLTPLHFPLLAMNLMHSRSLLEALGTAERYSSVISEGGRFSVSQHHGLMHLTYLPGDRSFSRDQIDTVLLLLKKFGEWLYCRSVPPVRVMLNFTVADSEVDEYQRAYGCLPEFGADKNVLVFETEWFQRPLPGGEPALAGMHQQLLDAQLKRVQQPEVRTRVERCLQEAVHLATDREDIASRLYMSVSTLQRRLGEAGTSFQQLLDTERERRATQLLRGTDLPISDISGLLGFADGSAFSKAFKRWQGMSPLQYRQRS